ncbi:MAG TPA: DNA repair protein RecO, partial [Acidobacteriaceae bacterium]|nr:DNA repair protein RecO [Acidobacteriaceae bacterium]
MIQRQTEAIVLRTWPFHESDMIVSLFTREQGKVKGIARAAMKSRKRFGGALEPMTHVRANYAEKPKQDLVRLDSFEILRYAQDDGMVGIDDPTADRGDRFADVALPRVRHGRVAVHAR